LEIVSFLSLLALTDKSFKQFQLHDFDFECSPKHYVLQLRNLPAIIITDPFIFQLLILPAVFLDIHVASCNLNCATHLHWKQLPQRAQGCPI
jgi:hypothetical protein